MNGRFCIKKNPTSVLNPWLSKMGRHGPQPGKLVYASLSDLILGRCTLETFPSEADARVFITKNPEVCSDQSVVCKVNTDTGEMEMLPT